MAHCRPSRHVRLTPTSSSWLNQVERFFALLTDRQIRRGVRLSVAALKTAITGFIVGTTQIKSRSAGPRSAEEILGLNRALLRVQRYSQTLISMPRTSGSGRLQYSSESETATSQQQSLPFKLGLRVGMVLAIDLPTVE
jgi:hypothetical protein